ncbi:MAG: AmmeMemoRadiSam system protein B [Bacteroides sp.]|nr:AmmeMemoRadiSam system protein B [Bacteroides sp.]
MKKRSPAVEGRFYPSTKKKILAQIELIDKEARYPAESLEITRILGAILPHAGHIYSGHQTIPFFKLLTRLKVLPDTFVIIHPNHRGMGAPIAIDDSDIWLNAIGELPTNHRFAEAMELPFDHLAHLEEHSAEVIIPFIQYYIPEHPFSLVAVCMRDQSNESARLVSQSILKAKRKSGQNIMVLASCDFSHFMPPDTGQRLDQYVVDQILAGSSQGVENTVREHNVSVCGYGPIMALMEYARAMDPDYLIKVLARGHSGEVFHSPEVVDYISMLFYQ